MGESEEDIFLIFFNKIYIMYYIMYRSVVVSIKKLIVNFKTGNLSLSP